MYKVSVVIPIYNVEKFIVRCAESLFKQTLDDIQFVFVDDASPDKSVQLLEQTLEHFPQRKPHTIILHHPQNMGLPAARATGLAHVTAYYVAHCDSDDYVEPTMYAKLYECAVQNDSDMVICGVKVHRVDGSNYSVVDKPPLRGSCVYGFLHGHLSAFVWTRLTRTDIYRKVQFPQKDFFEDGVQAVQLLAYSSKITFINECLYHYVWNPLSISKNLSRDMIAEKMHQYITNYYVMHDFVVNRYNFKEREFAFRKEVIRQYFLPLIYRKQYLQLFPELNFYLLFYWKFPWRYKVSHILILLGLYPIVRTTYRSIKKFMIDIRLKSVTPSLSPISTGLSISRKHV